MGAVKRCRASSFCLDACCRANRRISLCAHLEKAGEADIVAKLFLRVVKTNTLNSVCDSVCCRTDSFSFDAPRETHTCVVVSAESAAVSMCLQCVYADV